MFGISRHQLNQSQIIHDTADVLVKATGTLNKWKWPEIPGLENFKGKLLHSARWDSSFEPQGKDIAIIGNGSTGIQIIPALQPKARRIDTYIRSKAWVSPRGPFGQQVEDHGGDENCEWRKPFHWRSSSGQFLTILHRAVAFEAAEKAKFLQDPQSLVAYRKSIEETLHKNYLRLFTDSTARQEGARLLQELVREKLASKPGLFETLRPEWPVGCKRLGASPGYLEALVQDNVNVITSGIRRVRPEGIVDNGGTIRPVDAIICATGFDTWVASHFTSLIIVAW
jgi:cation diffusion facilitator CzcD-associated flavoprotein CzcO